MKIIISPAKRMRHDDSPGIDYTCLPVYLEDAEKIKAWMQSKSFAELKELWQCNDKIVEQNIDRLSGMDLTTNLTPAILSYDGIVFQYMAPAVFETEMLSYIQEHLRILSGFYGVLCPMDGVTPYRLEMQAKASIHASKNLYDFWGDKIYKQVCDESRIIINLASREYSKCIEKYISIYDQYITCIFAETENEKIVQKSVYCKMARGEMVRFMAENQIEEPEKLKLFSRYNYHYHEELSSDNKYVFLR